MACRKLLNPTEYIKSNSGMMIKCHFWFKTKSIYHGFVITIERMYIHIAKKFD